MSLCDAPLPERIPVGSEWTAQRAIDPCTTRTFQKRNMLLATDRRNAPV
ncbi:hypothetical protein A2U01_0114919, partial [Trifolium medium]|nr:hypothetical protein [Trifolium medium]